MIVCFTGTHGSGKTTVAKAVAEGMGLPFYPSRASEIHERLGVKANANLDFADRLVVQGEILTAWSYDFADARISGKGGVFDRCPIDFAAYLSSEIPRDLDAEVSTLAQHYIDHCVRLSKYLPLILFTRPLTSRLADRGDGKPNVDNVAYSDQIDRIIRGIIYEYDGNVVVLKPGTVEHRVASVRSALESDFARKCEEVAALKEPMIWQDEYH